MKFKFEEKPNLDINNQERISPPEMISKLEKYLKLYFGEIKVEGEENLKEIKSGVPVIVASSHISDFDMLITMVVAGKHFDIKFGVQSLIMKDALMKMGMSATGFDERVESIDFTKDKRPAVFNPENFVPMKKALDDGYAFVLAAHNPTMDWKLTKAGGLSVPYLASLEKEAYILPITVNIESDTPIALSNSILKTILKHPKVTTTIGKPILYKGNQEDEKHLDQNGEAESMEDVLKKKNILQDLSKQIMNAIAKPLPDSKKGSWGEKENNL